MRSIYNKRYMTRKQAGYFDQKITLRNVIILILILVVFSNNGTESTKGKKEVHDYEDYVPDKTEEISREILPYLYIIILFSLLNRVEEEQENQSRKKDDYDQQNEHSRFSDYNNLDNCDNYNHLYNNDNYESSSYSAKPLFTAINDLDEDFENSFQDDSLFTNDSMDKEKISAFLADPLKSDYTGSKVSAMLPDGVIVTGELVSKPDHAVALKHENSKVFINEDMIMCYNPDA